MKQKKSIVSRLLKISALIALLIGLGFIIIGPHCVDVVNTPIAAVGFPFIALAIILYIGGLIVSKLHSKEGPSRGRE